MSKSSKSRNRQRMYEYGEARMDDRNQSGYGWHLPPEGLLNSPFMGDHRFAQGGMFDKKFLNRWKNHWFHEQKRKRKWRGR